MRRGQRSGVASRMAWPGLICLLAGAAGALEARAESVLLRPQKDGTLIEESAGALSNGSGPSFFAGRTAATLGSIRRAILAFDVAAAIPPGSTVTRAVLWLNLSATNAGALPIRLHRLQADWGEGASASSGGGGAPSGPGDSTWIHRYYPDVFWRLPGGDFDPVQRAAATVDQPGPYSWGSTPEMVEDVQSWLDRPETAHGWLLAGDEASPSTVKRFDSREHPDETLRPLLEVAYVPPCSPDPAGPGYWRHQCEDWDGAGGGPGTEPGFAGQILPCANGALAELGLGGIDACDAVLSDVPRSCEDRAARKLSVLVLNLCAGRLQTSCPVATDDGACVSTTLGDLVGEIAGSILAGDCRRASGCASIPD